MSMSLFRSVAKLEIWKVPIRSLTVASNVIEDKPVVSNKRIPGPVNFPLIGNLPYFLPGGPFYKFRNTSVFGELNKRYGPIVQLNVPFTTPIVFVFDAQAAEEVLRKEGFTPVRPGLFALHYYREKYSLFKDAKIPHGFLGQGESWKYIRSVFNPIMLKPDVIKHYAERVDEVAQDMVKRIKYLRDENNMLKHLQDEMKLWMFESHSTIVLGRRMNCLDLQKKVNDGSPEDKLIKAVNRNNLLLEQLDIIPIWKYIPNKKIRSFISNSRLMEKTLLDYINMVKADMKNSQTPEEEKSIVQKILETDEEVAVTTVPDLLIGGVDTATNAAVTVMYALAIHPKKQKKLRMQLGTSEGEKYLKACVKETMRFMHSVSNNGRLTTADCEILGYRVPKNTAVLLCHEGMSGNGTDKYFYRGTEFIPERWLLNDKNDPLQYKNAHPFAFSPFGFGIRTCIGRRIAELHIQTLIKRLVENFSMEWHAPPVKLSKGYANTITAKNLAFKDV